MTQSFFIGTFEIHFYGIILMLGALVGALLAQKEAKRHGQNPEILWDMMLWILIGGIVGARLWHIFTPPPSSIAQGFTTQYYLTHPLTLINTRNGGLGIPGAVIAGLIVLYIFTRKRNLSFFEWADIGAPALALAQAIGRWGNYVNQELYGAPTSLPWKIYIDVQHRLSGFEEQAYYHPLFLYESLWNLGNMAILLWVSRRFPDRVKDGDIFLLYLIIYPLGRFLLDFLRLDASILNGINANQTVMAVVASFALFTLLFRHRKNAE
ncbi:MAG TPA: prolipoprotein diacylglyceryl transferase [Calditrichaeota bacterium]|nr:prolipoprotein diacylglyceryl transferase [Calditrichota bacterium]